MKKNLYLCIGFRHRDFVEVREKYLLKFKLQILPISQLSEHHHQQLIPASEVFHIAVATVFLNKVIEKVPV